MKSFIQHIIKVRHPLQLALIFLLLSLVMEAFFNSEAYNKLIFRRFQDRFVREQNEMELRMDNLAELLKNEKPEDIFAFKVKEYRDLAADRNISMYVFRNDTLRFWSDNQILESEILPAIVNDHKLVHLSNGWYFAINRQIGKYKIIGLLLIKNNYVIQNKYLRNSFNPIFSLPDEVKVKTNTFHEKYTIKTINGSESFALVFFRPLPLNTINYFIIVSCFIISIIFLIRAFSRLIQNIKMQNIRFLIILGFSAVLFLLQLFMIAFKFPGYLYDLSIFQPFKSDGILKYYTPGDLAISSILLYIMVFIAYTRIHLRWSKFIRNKLLQNATRIIALIILVSYFLFVNDLFKKIVYYSSLNFESFALSGINFQTVLSIISLALLFTIFIFAADYVFRTLFSNSRLKTTYVYTFSVIAIIVILYSFYIKEIIWVPALVLGLTIYIVVTMRKIWKTGFRYKHILFLIIAFSSYSVYVFFYVSVDRQEKEKKHLAMTLSTEHDVVAEYLISENGNKLLLDTTVRRMSLQKMIDYPWLFKYIRKKYFSGYWERYDMQITICRPEDSVLVEPELTYKPCFDFFDTLVSENAEHIKNSNFYYLKNSNGRISYFTQLNYFSLNEKASLFIQLDSRLNVEDIGYPELLLDQELQNRSMRNNYSYAKYYNGKLSYQSGTFLYNVSSLKYPECDSSFYTATFGGYDHLFFRANAENLIVLSKPSIRFFDLMVSFSYLFVFYFLLLNALLLAASPRMLVPESINGFKNRIRLSVIGVLLLSLIAVAGTTSYIIIEQYRSKHLDAMRDKLQSVYLELENQLSKEKELRFNWKSEDYSNLEELLRRLSNIFFTDINLYDQKGQLIASSRTEIFNKGIAGTLMNPLAFYQLSRNNKAEYRQFEQLGKLQYTSIYTTLVNGNNKFLAYLNLPYFTRQSQVVDEISSMLYAIINFYVIFILISISIAVFISEKVVYPLKAIQERFSRIKFGTTNEKIEYTAKDEIGGLVEEYNRMVDELERSVELLAKSEREMAWREMAKQVAHEIKNPLTPMKLSIQQLQRAWNDKHENFDDYMNKVTKTLIEQIENLSSIATEFSNFAKMPKYNAALVDLNELLKTTIQLFSESNVNIALESKSNEAFVLYADKDQMSRVFINLITNGLQAIPEDREGLIKIVLSKKEDGISIEFNDNGRGIPEQMIEKMFQPNFTTKTSGMGLGLAICKNIIENMGGKITFSTRQNEGSTFLIFLPFAEIKLKANV